MAFSTERRTSALTLGDPLTTRETVARETPATRATSSSVATVRRPRGLELRHGRQLVRSCCESALTFRTHHITRCQESAYKPRGAVARRHPWRSVRATPTRPGGLCETPPDGHRDIHGAKPPGGARPLRGRHRHRGPLPAADRLEDVLRLLDRLRRRRPEQPRLPGLPRPPGCAAGHQPAGGRARPGDRHRDRGDDAGRDPLGPQELLLPGPAQGLPDQPVRPAAGLGRPAGDRDVGGPVHRRRSRGPTSRRTRPSSSMPPMPTGARSASSTSTAPARRSWRSSPTPTSGPPSRPGATPRSCSCSCARSARRTPTWSAARCGSRRTCRCGARHGGVRDPGRGQEHELVPLGRAGDRVRDRPPGRRARRRRAAASRRRAAGPTTAARRTGCASKETSDDYRYFPEPDLPPLHVDPSWLDDAARPVCPELPAARRARYGGVARAWAVRRRGPRRRSRCRRRCSRRRWPPIRRSPPKSVANWVTGEYLRLRNAAAADAPVAGRRRPSSRRSSGRSRTARSRARTRRRSSRPTSTTGEAAAAIIAGPRLPPDLRHGCRRRGRRRRPRREPGGGRRLSGRQGPGGRLPRGPGDEGDARPGQRRRSSRPPSASASTGRSRGAHGTRSTCAVGRRRGARRDRLHASPRPVGALPGAQGPGRERRPLRVVARRRCATTSRPERRWPWQILRRQAQMGGAIAIVGVRPDLPGLPDPLNVQTRAAALTAQSLDEPPPLDRGAAVHDHGQPAVRRDAGRVPVDDAQLKPQAARPGGDGLPSVGHAQFGSPEDIDHVERPGRLDGFGQVRNAGTPRTDALVRVDRHAVEALIEEESEHAERRPPGSDEAPTTAIRRVARRTTSMPASSRTRTEPRPSSRSRKRARSSGARSSARSARSPRFSYGRPTAAGGMLRPTTPARTTIVTMYGRAAKNCGGMAARISPSSPAGGSVRMAVPSEPA